MNRRIQLEEYRFETDEGTASLADLFGGRSQLLIYHFMFGTDVRPPEAGKENPLLAEIASSVGTDWPTFTREAPGVSAFALEDGVVYHTYSA